MTASCRGEPATRRASSSKWSTSPLPTVRLGRPLSSRSRNISMSEKFRSCSSRAALTAGAITRRRYDPGMKDWRAWISKYLPGEDVRRPSLAYGYNSGAALIQVLKQAGNDLSRENIMRQATNLRDVELPMLLPGIKVNTSPTDYWAVQQLQLTRFDGKRWVRFGDLVYDE